MKAIIERLIKYIHDANDNFVIDPENDLDRSLRDLGIDSLDLMSVLFSVQDGYQIDIPDEDIEKLTTINSLARYIKQKQNDR